MDLFIQALAAMAATMATPVKVHSHSGAAATVFLMQWGQSVNTAWQTSLAIIVKLVFITYKIFGFITQIATLVSKPPNIPLGLTQHTPHQIPQLLLKLEIKFIMCQNINHWYKFYLRWC